MCNKHKGTPASTLHKYERMELSVISHIKQAEQDRLLAQVTANSATTNRACMQAYIHNRKDAENFLTMFTRLKLNVRTLSTETQVSLKRYLTIREYGQLLSVPTPSVSW